MRSLILQKPVFFLFKYFYICFSEFKMKHKHSKIFLTTVLCSVLNGRPRRTWTKLNKFCNFPSISFATTWLYSRHPQSWNFSCLFLSINSKMSSFVGVLSLAKWSCYFSENDLYLFGLVIDYMLPGSRWCGWWLSPNPNPSAPADIRGVRRSTRSTVQWPPFSTRSSPGFDATCRGSPGSWHSTRGSFARESYGMVRSSLIYSIWFCSNSFLCHEFPDVQQRDQFLNVIS